LFLFVARCAVILLHDVSFYKLKKIKSIRNICDNFNPRVLQQAVKAGGVDRLTDASQYTGAHRERFDASGRGRGIEGREEVHDNTGYVGGYKQKDTYDKKH
jgi:hypothetical protein